MNKKTLPKWKVNSIHAHEQTDRVTCLSGATVRANALHYLRQNSERIIENNRIGFYGDIIKSSYITHDQILVGLQCFWQSAWLWAVIDGRCSVDRQARYWLQGYKSVSGFNRNGDYITKLNPARRNLSLDNQ